MALPSSGQIHFGALADNRDSASRSDVAMSAYAQVFASGSAVGDVDGNSTANQTADRNALNSAPYALSEFYDAEYVNEFYDTVVAQLNDGTVVTSNGYVDGESARISFNVNDATLGNSYTVGLKNATTNAVIVDETATKTGTGTKTINFTAPSIDAENNFYYPFVSTGTYENADGDNINHYDAIGAVSITDPSDTTVAASNTTHQITHARSIGDTSSLTAYAWTFATVTAGDDGGNPNPTSATTSTPTVTYTGPGTYTANLTVYGGPSNARNNTAASQVTHTIEYTDSITANDQSTGKNEGATITCVGTHKGIAGGIKIGYVNVNDTGTFLASDTSDSTDSRFQASDPISKGVTAASLGASTISCKIRAEDRAASSTYDLSDNAFNVYPTVDDEFGADDIAISVDPVLVGSNTVLSIVRNITDNIVGYRWSNDGSGNMTSDNLSGGDIDGTSVDGTSIINEYSSTTTNTVSFDTAEANKTIGLILYGRLSQTSTKRTKTLNVELVDATTVNITSAQNGQGAMTVSGNQSGFQGGVTFGLVSSSADTTFLSTNSTSDTTDSRYTLDAYTGAFTPDNPYGNTATQFVQGRVIDKTEPGTTGQNRNTSTVTVYPLLTTGKNTINASRNIIYSSTQASDTSTYPPTVSYQTPGTPTDNVTGYLYSAGTSLTGHSFSAATSATTTYGGGSGVGSSTTSLRIQGSGASGTQTTTTTHAVTVNYEPRVYNVDYSTTGLTSGNFMANSSVVRLTDLDWQGFDCGGSGFSVGVYTAASSGGSEVSSIGAVTLNGTDLTDAILDNNTGGAQVGGGHCQWQGTLSLGTISSTGTVYVRVTDLGGSSKVGYKALTVATWNSVSVISKSSGNWDDGEEAYVGNSAGAPDAKSYLGTLGNGTTLYNDANGTGGVFDGSSKWHRDSTNSYVMVVNGSGVVSSYTADANIIPKAPTSIVFDSVTTSQIRINWTDNSVIEDGYKVYYATDGPADSGDTLLSSPAPTTTGNNYTHTGLSTRTPVVNSFSATVSSTVLGRIDLSWSLSTTDSFIVQQSTASDMAGASTIATAGTSLAVEGLVDNTPYYFRITATTSSGTTYYYGVYAYNGSSNTTVLQGSQATSGTSTDSSIVSATTINPTVTIANLSATTWASTTSGTVTCTTTPNFSTPELDVKIQRGATVYETDSSVVATKNVATTQTFSKSNMVLEGAYYDIVVYKAGGAQLAISDNAFTVTTKAITGNIPVLGNASGEGGLVVSGLRIYYSWTDKSTNETRFYIQVDNTTDSSTNVHNNTVATSNSSGTGTTYGQSGGVADGTYLTGNLANHKFYTVKVRAERVQTTDFTSTTTSGYTSELIEVGTVPESIDSVTFDQSSYVEGEGATVTYTSTNLSVDESVTIDLYKLGSKIGSSLIIDGAGGDTSEAVTLPTGLSTASDYAFHVFKTGDASVNRTSSTFTINATSITDDSPSDWTYATSAGSQTRDLTFTVTNPNPDGATATITFVDGFALLFSSLGESTGTPGASYAYSTSGFGSLSSYKIADTTISSFSGTNVYVRAKIQYDEDNYDGATKFTLAYNGRSITDGIAYLIEGCFDLTSPVLLSNGSTKQLHQIRIGDVVKSWNIPTLPDTDIKSDYMNWTSNYITGSTETTSVVTNIHFSASFDNYWYINSGSNYEFKVSSAHGIFVKDNTDTYKFKYANELTTNDKLFDSNLDEVDIISIETVSGSLNAGWIDVEDADVNYYAGILAHNKCFVEGTLVSMADGTQLPIEDIKIGDLIQTYDTITTEIRNTKVMSVANPIHDDIVFINFSNGITNENTFDHPYYVKDRGWCSYSPQLTKERYNIETNLLEIGDICYYGNELEEVTVKYIREELGNRQTYTIDGLESGNTFFANGIVVHNEGL